jgi:iron complex outermembrane receptor protein
LALALGLLRPVLASESSDFTELTLEELMSIEVVSASKKSQRLIEVASAVHVITQEEIRRSGHTSIPELLRTVPGLHVGRIGTSNWAISSRGFNSIFANKLLVLIDGRSVYTPLFAGTYWGHQDLVLDDVERIEVIRGPGATVWGANAVNGVINVITKSAESTQGGTVSVLTGNEDRARTSIRYAGAPASNLHVSLSGMYRNMDGTVDAAGVRQSDDFRQGRSAMRVEWAPSERDRVTAMAGWYAGDKGARNRRDTPMSLMTGVGGLDVDTTGRLGGNDFQLRWRRQGSDTSASELRLVTDYNHRNVEIFTQRRRNVYVDFQQEQRFGQRHDVVWGVGWRATGDRLRSSVNLQFVADKNREAVYSAFVQDEIDVMPNTLTVTLGSKLEWNTYTGWEVQPSARFMWRTAERHQVWGAVTRAVRMPSRAERELAIDITSVVPGAPFGPALCPCPAGVTGNPRFDSEVVWSYELGYRAQLRPDVHLDVAAFVSDYENLRSFAAQGTNPFLLTAGNRDEAQSWGVEVAARWQVHDRWRLAASYSATRVRENAALRPIEFDGPRDQYQASSHIDLPGGVELDTMLYYVGSYTAGIPELEIDRYIRTDMRVAWHVSPRLELSIVGQNLFEGRHPEARDFVASGANEIERTFYARMTWLY